MRLVLAGTGSAVGKTTITTGIMNALSKDYKVQPFKVGPDYIDPTYHTMATGNPSRNLDSFFMSSSQIIEAFQRGMRVSRSQIGIIEGVRGLYEGISPINDVGNTASIAKALESPIILILNARSLVKSAAAIVIGFKSLDPSLKIEGVILNQVKNKKHYLKAKESVEKLAKTEVIGGIPRDESIKVQQRHLGLVPAVERETILNSIKKWGQVIEENLDLDLLIEIMASSTKLNEKIRPPWSKNNNKRVKIGIAMDEVFSFYYQDNIDSLKDNKAKIVFLSPLKDEEIPDLDGIYMGGGYPEIFAPQLSANTSFIKSIKRFHEDGRPIYAECGGLMYLCNSICGYEMCDIFPYTTEMTKKVQGLSYVIAKAVKDNIIVNKGTIFRGHEFHYSKIDIKGKAPVFAFDILRGRGIEDQHDGLMEKNTLASYLHTHVAACPSFPTNFTSIAAEN